LLVLSFLSCIIAIRFSYIYWVSFLNFSLASIVLEFLVCFRNVNKFTDFYCYYNNYVFIYVYISWFIYICIYALYNMH